MRKRGRKLLAMLLALSMSMNVSMQAFADESVQGTVSVETRKDNEENVDVLISMTPNADGTIKTETKTPEGGSLTENGYLVKLEGTEIKDSNNNVIESEMEYDVQKGRYHAEGGSETTLEEKAPEVKVDVPLPNEENPENKNTVKDEDKADDVDILENTETSNGYNKITETVVEQGSATVETKEISVTEKIDKENGDLDYVYGNVEATDSNQNDLIYWGSAPVLPDENAEIEAAENYRYVLVGGGNISQYWGAYLSKTPNKDHPDPVYTDANGQNYYFPEIKNWAYPGDKNKQNTLKELYLDGEKVNADADGALSTWDIPEQYILVDSKTGELITTYCVDIVSNTEDGFSYNIQNLEDATYYSKDEAAMIRTIANVGYWATTDLESTEEAEFGSLNAMKEMMSKALNNEGQRIFSDSEIALLTDGIALSATQMAIWSFSNKMGDIEFVNAHYAIDNNAKDSIANYTWGSSAIGNGGHPADKKEEVDLLFKLYEYLINMKPTSISDENKNTGNTVINANNFLKDMSVTVIDKAEDHTNNKDDDDTNDAYVTDLTFALVVTPSTENGDDLIVRVLDKDNNVIASARIAGENKEGETYNYLTPDTNGNYIFDNIVLTEGEQNFNITMEGIQNLKEGVYLYTSEVQIDDGEEITSQTLIGVASGERGVNVSMNIKFDLSVEDEVVAREHVWRTEWNEPSGDGGGNDGGGGGGSNTRIIEEPPVPLADTIEIGENDVPLGNGVLNIEDSPIPLAVLPMTGDVSVIWMLISLISGLGLAGVSFADRKKRR